MTTKLVLDMCSINYKEMLNVLIQRKLLVQHDIINHIKWDLNVEILNQQNASRSSKVMRHMLI